MRRKKARRSVIASSDSAIEVVDLIKVKVGKKLLVFRISEEVAVPMDEDGLVQHPIRYAFWRRMLGISIRDRRVAEENLEHKRSLLDLAIREAHDRRGDRVMESAIRSEIWLHRDVQALRELLGEAQDREEICRMMCSVFEHRRAVLMKAQVYS